MIARLLRRIRNRREPFVTILVSGDPELVSAQIDQVRDKLARVARR